jgi:hypothetical protein
VVDVGGSLIAPDRPSISRLAQIEKSALVGRPSHVFEDAIRGILGWNPALPWDEPMALAVGLSLVMLGLGVAAPNIRQSASQAAQDALEPLPEDHARPRASRSSESAKRMAPPWKPLKPIAAARRDHGTILEVDALLCTGLPSAMFTIGFRMASSPALTPSRTSISVPRSRATVTL